MAAGSQARLLLLAASVLAAAAQDCPAPCKCRDREVDCADQGLEVPPQQVPHDTTTLDLRFNDIKELPEAGLGSLPYLETLLLNNNRLVIIRSGDFRGLPALRHLHLHRNRIHHVETAAFQGFQHLENLFLDNNRISSLENNSLGNLPSLLRLRLYDNPLKCDCDAVWLLRWLRDQPLLDATVFCGSPVSNADWPLLALSEGRLQCEHPNLDQNQNKEETVSGSSKVKRQGSSYDIPSLTREPEDTKLSLGEQLVLHCMAYGRPRPHIHWYHNNKRMTLGDRTRVLVNGTVVIRNVSLEDDGYYSCYAINVHGRATKTVAVGISVPPQFLIRPENKTVSLGERVNVICKARGLPVPEVIWYKNEEILEPSTNIVFNQDYSVLTIEKMTEEDEDTYKCRVENDEGEKETVFKIQLDNEVGARPKITQQPFDVEANLGSSVEFPCKSTGDPRPKVEWRKDGTTIFQSSKFKISSQGSLHVYNVSTTDNGRYECTVRNEFGRESVSGVLSIVGVYPGDQYVRGAIKQAIDEVDQAISNTIDALLNHKNHTDPFRVVRYPDAPARALARSAEIYERALVLIRKKVSEGANVDSASIFHFKDILSPEQIDTIAVLSGCTAHRRVDDCSDICYHNKYRSIDGTCNNLKYHTWGASLTGFRRILPPIYDNGLNLPYGWNKDTKYNGFPLPTARKVSMKLISTKNITADSTITHMVMQWGQFLDHDLDHALPSVSSQSWDGIDCKKSCEYAPPCFPMEVPPEDPRINNRRCIDFIRTSAVCGSGVTSIFLNELMPREQVNQLTSYIDGSQIYGFSKELAADLRDLTKEDGKLREGPAFGNRKPLLPFAGNQGVDCRRNPADSNINCFVAGDIRANEQIGLTAMHTIWMRQHNLLTRALKEINPFWDGEKLYQEARKIIGAQLQYITYEKWLPIIVGAQGMADLGTYKKYDPKLNPSISNVFATAALRFGHTLINPILHRYDENFDPIPQGHLELHKAFFSPWRIVDEGGIDPLIRGMFVTPAKLKKSNENLNDELTEKLFHSAHAVALDLAAMNIQRARDHAIPPYVKWRTFCNMSDVRTFEELKHEITDRRIRNILKDLYGTPENIDVFVGGILEDQVEGGKVGPLFRCLLVEQFKRLRDGDRLWYENPNMFKPEQLAQIKETSLSRIICDNGDNIDTISEDLFVLPELQDGLIDCEDLPSIDLRFWADCRECNEDEDSSVKTRRSVNLMEGTDTTNKLRDLEKQIEELKENMKYLESKIYNN